MKKITSNQPTTKPKVLNCNQKMAFDIFPESENIYLRLLSRIWVNQTFVTNPFLTEKPKGLEFKKI